MLTFERRLNLYGDDDGYPYFTGFITHKHVKQPVVCPNQHVFCSPCLDVWLQRNKQCPACRVPITEDNPCRPILGGLPQADKDDSFMVKELRHARVDLLFKEYEDEVCRLSTQNELLQHENQALRSKVKCQGEGHREDDTSPRSKTKEDSPGVQKDRDSPASKTDDVNMLMVLTKKLHDVTASYEKIKGDTQQLNQENETLKDSNAQLTMENQRLRVELANRSPRKFGRFTVAAMEKKLEVYDREVKQLQRALERSDAYIEDIEKELETYRKVLSQQKQSHEASQPHDKQSPDIKIGQSGNRIVTKSQSNDLNSVQSKFQTSDQKGDAVDMTDNDNSNSDTHGSIRDFTGVSSKDNKLAARAHPVEISGQNSASSSSLTRVSVAVIQKELAHTDREAIGRHAKSRCAAYLGATPKDGSPQTVRKMAVGACAASSNVPSRGKRDLDELEGEKSFSLEMPSPMTPSTSMGQLSLHGDTPDSKSRPATEHLSPAEILDSSNLRDVSTQESEPSLGSCRKRLKFGQSSQSLCDSSNGLTGVDVLSPTRGSDQRPAGVSKGMTATSFYGKKTTAVRSTSRALKFDPDQQEESLFDLERSAGDSSIGVPPAGRTDSLLDDSTMELGDETKEELNALDISMTPELRDCMKLMNEAERKVGKKTAKQTDGIDLSSATWSISSAGSLPTDTDIALGESATGISKHSGAVAADASTSNAPRPIYAASCDQEAASATDRQTKLDEGRPSSHWAAGFNKSAYGSAPVLRPSELQEASLAAVSGGSISRPRSGQVQVTTAASHPIRTGTSAREQFSAQPRSQHALVGPISFSQEFFPAGAQGAVIPRHPVGPGVHNQGFQPAGGASHVQTGGHSLAAPGGQIYHSSSSRYWGPAESNANVTTKVPTSFPGHSVSVGSNNMSQSQGHMRTQGHNNSTANTASTSYSLFSSSLGARPKNNQPFQTTPGSSHYSQAIPGSSQYTQVMPASSQYTQAMPASSHYSDSLFGGPLGSIQGVAHPEVNSYSLFGGSLGPGLLPVCTASSHMHSSNVHVADSGVQEASRLSLMPRDFSKAGGPARESSQPRRPSSACPLVVPAVMMGSTHELSRPRSVPNV